MSSDSSPPALAEKSGGAGLFQRIGSFAVGAGVTALLTQFYIYREIKAGNKLMLLKQEEIDIRLQALEKGKK